MWDSYYCLERLLEAVFTYDGVRNLGCTWLLFCVHANFLWSRRIATGLFVLCWNLGDVVCCMQVLFLDAYGRWRQDLRTAVDKARQILLLCFRFLFCVFNMKIMLTTSCRVFVFLGFLLYKKKKNNLLKLIIKCLRLKA